MTRTRIIAEPGSTHDGDFDRMLELVAMCAAAGATGFKSQWTSDAEAMARRRRAPEYLDSYQKLQYPLAWHEILCNACRAQGLAYGCTTYIPGDPALVAPYVDFLKVSSFEATDRPFLLECYLAHPHVIVSCGMQAEAIEITAKTAYYPEAVLLCTSSYPAPTAAMQLLLLNYDRTRTTRGSTQRFNGLSDHSRDVRMGAWAVCAGAQILETHVRLDSCDPANRDYAVAFSPEEFGRYVQDVVDAEAALGDGVWRQQPCEEAMLSFRVTA